MRCPSTTPSICAPLSGTRLMRRTAVPRLAVKFAPSTSEAFRLNMVEGLSAEETAQQVGISLAAVYTAKSRVLSRLRENAAQWLVELDLP